MVEGRAHPVHQEGSLEPSNSCLLPPLWVLGNGEKAVLLWANLRGCLSEQINSPGSGDKQATAVALALLSKLVGFWDKQTSSGKSPVPLILTLGPQIISPGRAQCIPKPGI